MLRAENTAFSNGWRPEMKYVRMDYISAGKRIF